MEKELAKQLLDDNGSRRFKINAQNRLLVVTIACPYNPQRKPLEKTLRLEFYFPAA